MKSKGVSGEKAAKLTVNLVMANCVMVCAASNELYDLLAVAPLILRHCSGSGRRESWDEGHHVENCGIKVVKDRGETCPDK